MKELSKGKIVMNHFKVGDIVRSKINNVYYGTYVVTKANKTTCWITINAPLDVKMIDGVLKNVRHHIYKNVRYSILKKEK